MKIEADGLIPVSLLTAIFVVGWFTLAKAGANLISAKLKG